MKKYLTISKNFIAIFAQSSATFAATSSRFVRILVDMFLQSESKFDLVSFNHGERVNSTKEGDGYLTGPYARKLNPILWISLIVPVHVQAAAISNMQLLDNRSVCHANAYKDLVSHMDGIRFSIASNAHVAFTVEQTSGVSVVHESSRDFWDDGEFGGHPMPGLIQARKGNTEPSRQLRLSGVCNEHVPSAEAKMCSELHGNMQRLAEMVSPVFMYFHMRSISKQVTDCNTNYIHWRPYAGRNMVPLDPDRFSVNQDAMVRLVGWGGNMTLSCGFLQGVITT
jgi:hypothetical protein